MDQQPNGPSRTFSADSGYFSQAGSLGSSNDGSKNARKGSIEEAEQFLASLGDSQETTTIISDAISSTPEGTVAPETPVSSPTVSNETETHVGDVDKAAYESMIWEGSFVTAATKRKRSRESSSDSKRVEDIKKSSVRKN